MHKIDNVDNLTLKKYRLIEIILYLTRSLIIAKIYSEKWENQN